MGDVRSYGLTLFTGRSSSGCQVHLAMQGVHSDYAPWGRFAWSRPVIPEENWRSRLGTRLA